MSTTKSQPDTLPFSSSQAWEEWLSQNHHLEEGIWLRFYKKSSNIASVTYKEAVDVALCYGWIDGQARSYDEQSYIQKFTPRRKRSIWSKVNRGNVERLITDGRMREPGQKAINAAKADGRWDAAYDSPSTSEMPTDFQAALDANPAAHAFYATLNKANTYAILWRLQTTKTPEARQKRMEQILEMLTKGETFHI